MPTPPTGWNERSIAATLAEAEAEAREVRRFTADWPEFDLDTAYRVQRTNIDRRARLGRPRVGVKLGLTSLAKQQQMGVAAPLTGILTADMTFEPGETLALDALIHPKVEPELAFVFDQELSGADVDAATVRAAVRSVHAGIEIIDSRYLDFEFRLPDVVADNASSAKYLVSPLGLSLGQVDPVAEAVTMRIDGTVVGSATGAAVMGDPLEAIAVAVRDLASRGDGIRAGEIVLSGALTDAKLLSPGSITTVEFATLGSLELRAVAAEH